MLSIVDSYDMMVNNSVYSPEISIDDALKELNKLKGSKYNPELTDQFTTMMKHLL